MITKKYIIIFILIIVLFVNGFSFWKFFLPAKILNKKNGIESFSNNIRIINEAKKNIGGKVFCTTMTEKKDIVTGEKSENSALPVKKIYSLSILNGSGVSGAAKSCGDKLKGIEWIHIVTFGNSQKTGQTILKLKNDLPIEDKKILIQSLTPDYSNIKEEIDEKIGEDIVIVLGSE